MHSGNLILILGCIIKIVIFSLTSWSPCVRQTDIFNIPPGENYVCYSPTFEEAGVGLHLHQGQPVLQRVQHEGHQCHPPQFQHQQTVQWSSVEILSDCWPGQHREAGDQHVGRCGQTKHQAPLAAIWTLLTTSCPAIVMKSLRLFYGLEWLGSPGFDYGQPLHLLSAH